MHAEIPSPSHGVVHLGPFPLRAYALAIILGIVAAVVISERRLRRQGYRAGAAADIAVWAVPFGIVGGRIYHVITDNQLYFRSGRHPLDALKIWDGGLGIWGAIGFGALGAYIGARRHGVDFRTLIDAAAPGVAVAQGIGRWGNYFNQELYGRPTHLPWAVRIDPAHRLPDYAGVALYHPTFLYESLWDLGTAAVVVWAGRRYALNRGRTFALYVAVYCVGRFWIEALRIDSAHRYLGLRLNDYTAIVLFLAAVAYVARVRGADPAVEEAAGAAAEGTPAELVPVAVGADVGDPAPPAEPAPEMTVPVPGADPPPAAGPPAEAVEPPPDRAEPTTDESAAEGSDGGPGPAPAVPAPSATTGDTDEAVPEPFGTIEWGP